jgi:hypothetical protein
MVEIAAPLAPAGVQEKVSNTQLQGAWLWVARFLWGVLFSLSLGVFVYAAPVGYARLMTPCTPPGCADDQLLPATIQMLAQNGVSLRLYVLYNIGLSVLFSVVYLSIAALIFWRRSDDRMTIFASLTLTVFGVFPTELVAGLAGQHWVWIWLLAGMELLMVALFITLLYLFPNGRFVPGWTRWLTLSWVAMGATSLLIGPFLPHEIGRVVSFAVWPAPIQFLVLLVLFGAGIWAQVYRYRRTSNPLQRQQTKWVVFGLVVAATAVIGVNELLLTFAPGWMANGTLSRMVIDAIIATSIIFTALTFGIAILRYRLWDIDVVIRRTLIYAVLSGLLALTYFGTVLLIETVRPVVWSQHSQAETVLATLLIAALFTPLRRAVQHGIDRRFYRKRYNSDQVLARFSAKIRNEVELETLRADLVGVVQETMQPAHVALWLMAGAASHPAGLIRGSHA